MSELEKAVGQYGIYRTFLKRIAPDRSLYLAVNRSVYQDFFQRPAIDEIIADHHIKLLITEEGITQELLDAGLTQEDIVLGFYRPENRALTGLATA